MARFDYTSEEDSRRHERGDAPGILLQIGKQAYSSTNWSLGGALIDEYGGPLSTGSLLHITSIGPIGGAMVDVCIRARVTKIDFLAMQMVVNFMDIDGDAYYLLGDMLSKHIDNE